MSSKCGNKDLTNKDFFKKLNVTSFDELIDKVKMLVEYLNYVPNSVAESEKEYTEEEEKRLKKIIKEEMSKFSKDMEEYKASHPIFYDEFK